MGGTGGKHYKTRDIRGSQSILFQTFFTPTIGHFSSPSIFRFFVNFAGFLLSNVGVVLMNHENFTLVLVRTGKLPLECCNTLEPEDIKLLVIPSRKVTYWVKHSK